jgi:hypothetical protein
LGAAWAEIQLVFDHDGASQYLSQPDWLLPRSTGLAALAGLPLGLAAGVVYASVQSRRQRLAVVLMAGAILGAVVPFLLPWSPPHGRPLVLGVLGMLVAGALHWIVVRPFTVRELSTGRRWSQFSLRSMFAAVAVFAVGLTIYVSRPVTRWRVRTELVEQGCQVTFEPGGPEWLAWLLGVRSKEISGRLSAVDVIGSSGSLPEKLEVLAEVEKLHLSGSRADNSTLRHIAGLMRLKVLDLESTPITDTGLECVRGMRSLESLNVGFTSVTDTGLESLRGLASLRELHLYGTNVTGPGFEQLRGLPKLEVLTLHRITASDGDLAALAHLTRLRRLGLMVPGISDTGLMHVAKLRNLEGLYLKGTKITDAGLMHLSSLTHLKEIALDGTGVTDAGLASLEVLPELRVVSVQWTAITGGGMDTFNDHREHRGLPPVSAWFFPVPPPTPPPTPAVVASPTEDGKENTDEGTGDRE